MLTISVLVVQRLHGGHFDAFAAQYETSEVRSLKEMVEWNEKHAELTMPAGMSDDI